MRGRLASKKIGVRVIEAEADEGGQSRVTLKQPAETVSNTVKLGNGPEAAPAVVDLFGELGLM